MSFSFKHSVFVLILLFAAAFCGCSANNAANKNAAAANTLTNNNSKAEIVPKEDIDELGKIIKLPILPEEAIFIEQNSNNEKNASNAALPNDKKLIAVLKFSGENADRLAAQAEKQKNAAPADIDAETWFPPELIAKSQETGDEFLKGMAFSANDFLQPPYLNGRLTRLNDTDYFVLEVTAF